jgi:uncharacterized membrane protein
MKTFINSFSNKYGVVTGGSSALKQFAACATLVVTSVAATFAQPVYTLTELPVPAGYRNSVPNSINDAGYVVGYSIEATSLNGSVATVWKNGSVKVLGKLPKGIDCSANAINSNGVVVGDGDDGDYRPLGWITSGSTLVNFFSNNGGNTHPIFINEKGDTVGGYYIKGFSSTWLSAIWKIDAKDPRKSTKLDLPLLVAADPTKASSTAYAFNKSTQAAGYVANEVIGSHAAFWNNDATHSLFDLGVYQFDWSSSANSLNDLGQVVGSSHPPFGSRAILWNNDATHTAIELPLLPGDNYGDAKLINNSGTIIGSSAYGEPGTWNITGTQLVIWSNGEVYNLQSTLDATGEGWTIQEARSMNNLGQIVGTAWHDGASHAIVITPVQ